MVAKFDCEVEVVSKVFGQVTYFHIYFREMANLSEKRDDTQVLERRRKEIQPHNFEVSDFHKFFESNENGKVYSLQYSNNIFIKEDNNKPVKKLVHISDLRNVLRGFFVVMMLVCLVTLVYTTYNNFVRYVENGNRMLAVYNTDLYMGYYEVNIYSLHYYNLGLLPPALNTTLFFSQSAFLLQNNFQKLSQLKNDVYLKKSIFDEKVNPPNKYLPSPALNMVIANGSFTITSYDESDLPIKLL